MMTVTFDVFGTMDLHAEPKKFGRGQVTVLHGASIDGTPWCRVTLISRDGVEFASFTLMGAEREAFAAMVAGGEDD